MHNDGGELARVAQGNVESPLVTRSSPPRGLAANFADGSVRHYQTSSSDSCADVFGGWRTKTKSPGVAARSPNARDGATTRTRKSVRLSPNGAQCVSPGQRPGPAVHQ